MGLFEKLKNGLKKTTQQFSQGLGFLLKAEPRLSKEELETLEENLVRADVGVSTARQLAREVEDLLKEETSAGGARVSGALKKAILRRFAKVGSPSELPKPVALLLVGVNGAGKTTTAGKLATRFVQEGRKVLLAAGDTFRAAAEEQLTEWAGRARVELLRGEHGASPSAVVFDALRSGFSKGMDCVVVDTAGRLHNRKNLMEELGKMARTAEKAAPGVPLEKWLVLDANTGQNALNQAREFHQGVGLTGVVLTKLDGTAKGGIVLALVDQVPIPIRYLGVGEGLEDLIPFDPEMFAQAFIPDAV